jgi:phospholipid/cholesterol/gamma-HCH transport system ATP-binding protein
MPALETDRTPLYVLKNVRCGFGSYSVLKGLDWTLEFGHTFAVLGPSGEGKTLFLKALAGLVPQYGGSIAFRGVELRQMTSAQRLAFRLSIGMTFQKDGLFDSLSCADNLRFPLRERLVLTTAEREKRVEKGLEEVGLAGQGRLMVHEMSGGMQKRLGIARALLFSPAVILYDEPSAGLDPITARSINELILQMREAHQMTVVVVTSDLSQARQLADQMGLLWKGRFEQMGSRQTLEHSSNAAVHQFFHASPQGPLTEGLS